MVDVGNIISADHDPTAGDVTMSNGLTSAFLDVLLLSGSELPAPTPKSPRSSRWQNAISPSLGWAS